MNDGPDGNLEDEVRTIAPALVAAFSMVPPPGFLNWIEPEFHQRIVLLVGAQNDMAAASAISAGRASSRNILLSPKRDATASAVPRLD